MPTALRRILRRQKLPKRLVVILGHDAKLRARLQASSRLISPGIRHSLTSFARRTPRITPTGFWSQRRGSRSIVTSKPSPPNHVYTCYRAAKWPTDIADFGAPLRNLKHQQLMIQTEEGYVINHLGLARVEEQGKE
jgi:hypothetical protein